MEKNDLKNAVTSCCEQKQHEPNEVSDSNTHVAVQHVVQRLPNAMPRSCEPPTLVDNASAPTLSLLLPTMIVINVKQSAFKLKGITTYKFALIGDNDVDKTNFFNQIDPGMSKSRLENGIQCSDCQEKYLETFGCHVWDTSNYTETQIDAQDYARKLNFSLAFDHIQLSAKMKHLNIVGPSADLTFYSIIYNYHDDGSLSLSFTDLSHCAQAKPNTLFNVSGPEACLAVVETLDACGQFVEDILSMTLPNVLAPIPAMPGIASSSKVAAPGTPSAPGGPIIPMSSHLSQQ